MPGQPLPMSAGSLDISWLTLTPPCRSPPASRRCRCGPSRAGSVMTPPTDVPGQRHRKPRSAVRERTSTRSPPLIRRSAASPTCISALCSRSPRINQRDVVASRSSPSAAPACRSAAAGSPPVALSGQALEWRPRISACTRRTLAPRYTTTLWQHPGAQVGSPAPRRAGARASAAENSCRRAQLRTGRRPSEPDHRVGARRGSVSPKAPNAHYGSVESSQGQRQECQPPGELCR